MPGNISKQVDKTLVNFQDKFTYTIGAGFSGIEGDINSAIIKDFIPDYIDYILPPIVDPLKEIREIPTTGGTIIEIDYKSIEDLGISISFDLICQYKLGTPNNQTFINEANLYINDDLDSTASADEVILQVTPDFIIKKTAVVPIDKISTQGSRVIYTIVIENIGDKGAVINDVLIKDILPVGLTVDSSNPPTGNDISPSPYNDTRYNNLEGTVIGNTIIFNLPDYYGTKYQIIVVANVDPDAPRGSLDNTSTLSIEGVETSSYTETIQISDPTYTGTINKNGPMFVQVGDLISYDFSVNNLGNQDLLNVEIIDEIPSEVKPTRIRTPEFWIAPIETSIPQSYTIEYEVNNTGPFISLGTFNTNSSQIVTLPVVTLPDKITKIKYNIGNIPVGATQDVSFIIDGEVISTNSSNLIVNKVTLEYEAGSISQTKESTVNTQVSDLSYLNISKSLLTNQSVIPGNIVKYRLTVPANNSQINNPRIIDILDENLTYIGNEFYSYYDYFSGTTITSNNPSFPTVTKQVVPNYNTTNKTLIRYELDNFSIQQRGVFYVDFEASVNVGALGTIPNNSYLGNSGPYGYAPGGLLDTNDLDNDGITNENLAISNIVNLNALLFAGLKSDKKVKGELDSVFTEEPNKGKTYEGGIVEYKLEITNIGNVNLESIEIVDILPHIGDTGVILTDSPRDSEFAIYSVKDISATLSDSSQSVDLKVEYSQSYNPVRFSSTNFGNDTIGVVNDWTQLPPNPIVNTKSFKVTTLNTVLKPKASIIVSVKCIAPVGVNLGEIAWNSFAIKGSYLDLNNNLKYLTPVEPEKVGVEIVNVASNKVCIEGFAFLDKNINGKFDNTDEGLNGVVIELYDENFNLVKDTLTTNNTSLQPGYYIFNNIDIGKYYIKFIKPQDYQYTIKVPGGDSKIDPITGFTSLIVANTPGQCVTNIGGGFVIPNWAYIILNFYNINILEFCCEDDYCEFLNDLSDKIYILLDIIQRDLELESSNFIGFDTEIEKLICKLDELKAKYYSFIKDCPNDDKYYGEYLCEISRMLINLMITMQYYHILKENLKLNPFYSYYKCILSLFSNQIDLL